MSNIQVSLSFPQNASSPNWINDSDSKSIYILLPFFSILLILILATSLNAPRPIVNVFKFGRSKYHYIIVSLILEIEKLETFMKLLDSFSIEPIMRFCNEGSDVIDTVPPNLEKLYSPISIEINLELLYIWNSLVITSGLSSLQNDLRPILNEINSGKQLKRTSLAIDLKQSFPISIISIEDNEPIDNVLTFWNDSSPIINEVKLSRSSI